MAHPEQGVVFDVELVVMARDGGLGWMRSKRADELLSVGQPLAALSSISEVFSSKRFRTTPLSTLEPILIKFLSLCVDLRKGRTAKEGLHVYKNVAQNTSVGSVEIVIQKFLEQSRQKLTEALAKVEELEGPAEAQKKEEGLAAEVEDLEASETPESILLSSVSEEKSRDRTYRTLVTPWLRFLWEAYRTALDTLRNNARLETVSHEAFQFCMTHQRKTEFRRLAEMLRSHVTASQKYSHQSHSINLNDPDTLQRHLDTRFQQLNTAVELELWQEAFRTAEDIHTLVGMSKRAPKASMMASFYEKMVKVFGVGQNYLFHAAAYGKLYSLHAARAATPGDKPDDAELAKLSSLVLLSALAVPLGAGESSARREGGDESEAKGKLGRLAALLGLANAPTRAGLISDALSRHVLKRVSPELRSLYNILEVDFHPLSITSKIEPILATLEQDPETARYVEPLKEVVLARLFQQLAQVYASLKIERVVRLASFQKDADKEVTRKRVERFITEACRRGDLDVTIDHATGAIKFDEDLFGSEATPVASSSATPYDSVKTLQPSASTLLRTHLTRLASTLYTTLEAVSPHNSPLASALASKALAFTALEAHGSDERDTLMARTQIIKRRKELADEQTARKEKEEAHQRTLRAQQKAEEDARKQVEDKKNRELEKMRKELAEEKKKETARLLQALIEKTGQKAPDTAEQEEMSAEKIFQLGVQHIEKEKKDLAQKLSGVTKRIDHLERAFRKEEIPLLKQDYERQQTRDRETHVATQKLRVESSKKQHAEDLAIKARLVNILPDYHAFRTRTEGESRAAYDKQAAKLAEQLEEAKAERRAEIQRQREAAEQQRLAREAQEAARRAQEEEEARQRAEDEEREAAEKAAIEERKRKMEEEAAERRNAQLAEREAERQADRERIAKQMAREEEAAARRANRTASGPPAVGSAEWRAQRNAESAAAPAAGERPRLALAPRTQPTPTAAAAGEPARPSGPPQVVAPGGAKPSWRDREAARAASGGSPTPAPPAASGPPRVGSGSWSSRREQGAGDADGFQPAPARGAYRPPGAQQGETPRSSSGAYRPPGAGGSSRWSRD
ncbi:translation initiation factor eIF-3 subunit 10 [Pseudohyphozyma bogoriensis]|nr:translation initiation factor eIF-3 subunit 10 [Pseudohyphozyma bogoriensis]